MPLSDIDREELDREVKARVLATLQEIHRCPACKSEDSFYRGRCQNPDCRASIGEGGRLVVPGPQQAPEEKDDDD